MKKKIEKKSSNDKKISDISSIRMGRTVKNKSGSKTVLGSKTKRTKNSVVKKRGHRTKKIFDESEISSDREPDNEVGNNKSVIVGLRLPFDVSKSLTKVPPTDKPKKGKTVKKTCEKKKGTKCYDGDTDNNDDSENDKINYSENSDSSEGMFRNDIPKDNYCHNCVKNEKALAIMQNKLDKYEKKEQLDRSIKIHVNKLNFVSMSTGKKVKLSPTKIRCWYDTHKFTTLPCVLPDVYHNDTYYFIGCFCSFNCALAYNLYNLKDSKMDIRKALTYKLYREIYDIKSDKRIEIKIAPERQILESYGGKVSINEFRQELILLEKEFVMYMPPLKAINIVIEERSTSTNNDNDKEYVLRRNKPLANKSSIISSMIMNDGSD